MSISHGFVHFEMKCSWFLSNKHLKLEIWNLLGSEVRNENTLYHRVAAKW